MKFLVEFKAPGGEKIVREIEADSHWGAAQEATFEADIVESLLATGKTKFGARVRRCSDNVTRSVLVEVVPPESGPLGPGAPGYPVAAPNRRNELEVTIPEGVGSGPCDLCRRERVPTGYTITLPEGSVLCKGCSLPLPLEEKPLEGFEEVQPEYDKDFAVKEEPEPEPERKPTKEVIDAAVKEASDRVMERLLVLAKAAAPEVLEDLEPELRSFLEDRGILAKRCEGCNEEATEEDCKGVPLCDDCYLEMLEEGDEETPIETAPEKRHYSVIFGDHLEPGHEDRIAMRVKSPNPRAALTAAEYAVKERKGEEWLTAFYSLNLTPTIDACEAPEEDRAKKFVDAEAPEIESAPETSTYSVHFFCGEQALTVNDVPAEDAEAACGVAAAMEVEVLQPFVGASGVLAAQAVNQNVKGDNWGPGVVRIPVELVVSYDDMSGDQRRSAESAIGITRYDSGPALDLGPADPKVM